MWYGGGEGDDRFKRVCAASGLALLGTRALHSFPGMDVGVEVASVGKSERDTVDGRVVPGPCPVLSHSQHDD